MQSKNDAFGRALEAFSKIRFGPGVVARVGVVIGLTVVVLGALGIALAAVGGGTIAVLSIAGMILLATLVFVPAAFWYAHTHPEAAALDSAHLMKVLLGRAATAQSVPIEVQDAQSTLIENPKPLAMKQVYLEALSREAASAEDAADV